MVRDRVGGASRWLGHVDVRLPGSVGVGHDPGDDVAEAAIEEKRVAAAQVAEFGDVARDVVVEVGAGERCPAVVVIGAEGEGQRAAATCFVFEAVDEQCRSLLVDSCWLGGEVGDGPGAELLEESWGGWNVNLTLHEVDCREDRRL